MWTLREVSSRKNGSNTTRTGWPNPAKTRDELVTQMEDAVMEVPGNNYEFTQPIEMRFNELISGVRSDLAVKIYGDDFDTLIDLGDRANDIIETVPGAADVKVEQITGLPMLTVALDRKELLEAIARQRRESSPPEELSKSELDEPDTVLVGPGAAGLRIGDLVWFRHAKSGEVAEHVREAHLVRGDEVVDVVPTYRGTGNAW